MFYVFYTYRKAKEKHTFVWSDSEHNRTACGIDSEIARGVGFEYRRNYYINSKVNVSQETIETRKDKLNGEELQDSSNTW